MPKIATGLLDDPEALEARFAELERKMDRLRALYESYFMGVERQPPVVPRRDLNRLMFETQQIPINNASHRFRFKSLSARWVLFTIYWNRTLRELEAGTYRRDLAKAQRRLAMKGGVLTEAEAIQLGIPATRAKAFVERQMRLRGKLLPVPDEQQTPPPITTSPPPHRLADGEFDTFYKRYVDAHQTTGTPLSVEPAALRAKLDREIARIMAAKSCARVDLDVQIDGGKVRLRARPVKG